MKDFAKHITEVVLPKLQKELGIKNSMATPRITKIVVNAGIGTLLKNTKDYSNVVNNITTITGQKPVVTMAKKAISNFKLRADTPNGVMATLRKRKMIDFYNRMINVAFPRIRDFQGFTDKAFDGQGNYSIGIRDCSIFPEINPDDLSLVHGMSITIVTSAENDDQARQLLRSLGFPFKKTQKQQQEQADAVAAEAAETQAPQEQPAEATA